VCFSPRHDLTLPELSLDAVQGVVQSWTQQTEKLRGTEGIQYVQVFENKGEMMGCSNPHPHSQIWATGFLPDEPAREQAKIIEYSRNMGECLICKILAEETDQHTRVVCENQNFTALVPFWAVWPFEILVISRRHCGSLPDLDKSETRALADILRQVTTRYDNLFGASFPYSMGFHQAPGAGKMHPENHLHAHFYPPLLRSATVRKFMVGFEMLAMPQRDLTPELAAERLKEVSDTHYRTRNGGK
jgi:UDPglucose--hexose-1-phosphate uridylyltransferase